MRFLVIVKVNEDSEAGVMPGKEMLDRMTRYNEDLVGAGVVLAGEILHPSSRGVRIRFSGDECTVIDGPFAETKKLMGGYWLWQCDTMGRQAGSDQRKSSK